MGEPVRNFEKGSSLVEFAFVVPVLALLVFGIMQYGLIFFTIVSIKDAAAFAAREAQNTCVNAHSDCSAVLTGAEITAVNNATIVYTASTLKNPTLTGANITLTRTNFGTGGSPLWGYQASVSYSIPLIVPYVVPSSSGGKYTFTTVAAFR